MTAWILLVTAAFGADVTTVRACEDAPEAGNVKWAVQRTVSVKLPDGTGTGVVVSPDGVVLTAAHVVKGVSEVEVVFADGSTHPARVVRTAEESDLALLRSDATDWPCMHVRPTPADVGSEALVIGSPGGDALSHSVSKGIVSGYRNQDGVTLVQTDAAINQGNSGGPLVGETGELLGVVSFKLVGDGVEGLGFAVASTDVPTALSLRWGTATDEDDAAEGAVIGVAATSLLLPEVEPGPGVSIDTSRTYSMARRPNERLIRAGISWAILGAATVGTTYAIAKGTKRFDRTGYDTLVVTNTLGWTMLGGGGVALGAGFVIPSKRGPIEIEEAP